ncbi:MAG: DUF1559 domain-containing protein, partial [Clostridia bacterium]|nr:DUF1559 domain-containing protein [Clostridia bacterium]
LQKARAQALNSSCVNNQKQISLGLAAYYDAYDGTFPGAKNDVYLLAKLNLLGRVGDDEKSPFQKVHQLMKCNLLQLDFLERIQFNRLVRQS